MTQTTIYDLPGVKSEQPDGMSLMALVVWPVLAFRRTARMTKPADKTDHE